MNKKNVLIVGFGLVIVALLAGGYFRLGQKQPGKYAGPVEKIAIGNLGEYSILNLIAKDRGYFVANGLDAEIQEYQAGPLMIADLLAGRLNFAVAGEFPGVNYIFQKDNLRILTETSKQKVVQVVARKDKGINNPGDLKGKKIGVMRKSAGEFFLGRFLTFNNLAFSDVSIIDLSPAEMTKRIVDGQIDAVASYEPNPYKIAKRLGDNAVVWSAQGNQDTFALLYSTDEFIKSHPQIVERYLRSLMEAEQYVKDYDKEARNIVAKILHYDEPYIKYIWPKVAPHLALEQELVLTMENEAHWAIQNKLTDKTVIPNYLDYIYFDALEKARPEAITIIHK